jgi:hypothetical protein
LRSIELLLERHDVLNSSIETDGENLYLVCDTKKPVAFREVIITGKTAGEREDEAYRIANNLVWEEYDLDNGPLYRVFLIRLSAIEYILGVALHHAIGDMISIGIMFQELFSIYHSVTIGTPLRVMPTRLRYMDYLASMESWSESAACEEHIRYWKYKLKSTPVTDLLPNVKRSLNETISESTASLGSRDGAGTYSAETNPLSLTPFKLDGIMIPYSDNYWPLVISIMVGLAAAGVYIGVAVRRRVK